jgi:hypothetical protein
MAQAPGQTAQGSRLQWRRTPSAGHRLGSPVVAEALHPPRREPCGPIDGRSQPAWRARRPTASAAPSIAFRIRFSDGQIFDPRQQLLVHRPRDVGQDARPIHSSSTPADSRSGQKILASATRRGHAGNEKLTVFLQFLFFDLTRSRRDLRIRHGQVLRARACSHRRRKDRDFCRWTIGRQGESRDQTLVARDRSFGDDSDGPCANLRAAVPDPAGSDHRAVDGRRRLRRYCHVNRKFADRRTMAVTVHAATVARRHVSIA